MTGNEKLIISSLSHSLSKPWCGDQAGKEDLPGGENYRTGKQSKTKSAQNLDTAERGWSDAIHRFGICQGQNS